MQSCDSTSNRAKFVAAVHASQGACEVHVSQAMSRTKTKEFVQDILRRPAALTYLTRHASQVAFNGNIPQLVAPKTAEDKKRSDYHELQLHRIFDSLGSVPFRGDLHEFFTTQGARPREFELLFHELSHDCKRLRQVVTRPLPYAKLRGFVEALSHCAMPEARDVRFALTPMWEMQHATAVLTIYNPSTRAPLAAVFINSLLDPNRFAHALRCFQEGHPKQVPFIDASHALQISRNDHSCTIYSYNMLRAMSVMLGQGNMADRVLRLAQRVNRGDALADMALQRVFTVEIRTYLQQYYGADGVRRSQAELDTYNAQARWNLGARSIGLLAQRGTGARPRSRSAPAVPKTRP